MVYKGNKNMFNTIEEAKQIVFYSLSKIKSDKLLYGDNLENRAKICRTCEHKKQVVEVDVCEKCGCILVLKTKLKSSTCPINRW
jgi:hypothetical protein